MKNMDKKDIIKAVAVILFVALLIGSFVYSKFIKGRGSHERYQISVVMGDDEDVEGFGGQAESEDGNTGIFITNNKDEDGNLPEVTREPVVTAPPVPYTVEYYNEELVVSDDTFEESLEKILKYSNSDRSSLAELPITEEYYSILFDTAYVIQGLQQSTVVSFLKTGIADDGSFFSEFTINNRSYIATGVVIEGKIDSLKYIQY